LSSSHEYTCLGIHASHEGGYGKIVATRRTNRRHGKGKREKGGKESRNEWYNGTE
jgi:hypothetical protein